MAKVVNFTAPKVALCLDPEISGPFVVIDDERVSLDQMALDGLITKDDRAHFGWLIYRLSEVARNRQAARG